MTRFARLSIVLSALAVSASAALAAKPLPPVATRAWIDPLPARGQDGVIRWSAVPALTPDSATLLCRVTRDGVQEAAARAAPELAKGETAFQSFSWNAARPGLYRIHLSLTFRSGANRYAAEEVLFLDVPENGPSRLRPEPVLDADAVMAGAALREKRPAFLEAADPGPAAAAGTKAAGFTVQGVARFRDRFYEDGPYLGVSNVPARRLRVEIRDAERTGSVKLGTVTTDEDGAFSFRVPDNDDGPGEGRRDLFVRLRAEGDTARVTDLSGKVHYYDTPVHTNWPGGTLDLGLEARIPLASSAPFNIHDAGLRGFDFAAGQGTPPPFLTCRWAPGNADGTHYHPGLARIDLLGKAADDDAFDDDVILHEFGHFCADTLSEDNSPGGAHSWTDHISPRLAWSEGWASFFSCAVRNRPSMVDHYGSSHGTIDLEGPTRNVTGNDNEGAVAATLWDLFDDRDDNLDRLSDGVAGIWSVFASSLYFNPARDCVMDDFREGWVGLGRGSLLEFSDILSEHQTQDERVEVPASPSNTWTRGSTYAIAWSGFEGDATVKLELCRGDAPVAVIAEAAANTGFHAWTIPAGEALDDGYRIRISSPDREERFDYSDHPFSIQEPAGGAPPTPDGVTAGDGTHTNRIRVLWNPAAGATAYEVWRGASADPAGAAKIADPLPNAFDDDSTEPGEVFHYWIRAVNTEGTSDFSAADSGYRAGSTTVTLRVNGPAFTGELSPSGDRDHYRFVVETNGTCTIETSARTLADTFMSLYGPDDEGAFLEQNDDGGVGAASKIVRTLQPGTYYITIRAFDDKETGTYDIRVLGAKPPAPTGIKASDGLYQDRVRVTWNAVPEANKYEVWRAAVNNAATASRLGVPTAAAYNDNTAVPGTVYYYWIKSRNPAGASPFSRANSGYRAEPAR